MLCSDVMDYCRKVSPLEDSKNRDCLFKKLVRLCVCVCMCVWVDVLCVCVYGGGWVDVWVCVFVWVGVWRWGGDQCGVYVGCAYVRVNIFGRGCKY